MCFFRTFFVLLLFVSSLALSAQLKESDLDKMLQGKDYLKQIQIYDSLAIFNKNDNASLAFSFSQKAIEISIQNSNDTAFASALNIRAKVYRHLADYVNAEKDLDSALTIFLKNNDKNNLTNVYMDLGNVNYSKGAFNIAIDFYLKALKYAEDINDKHMEANSYNNIGNVYFVQGEYDKTISNYQKAYDINKRLGDNKLCALTLDNIGMAYSNKKEYDMALLYQTSALKMVEKLDDKQLLAESLMSMGALYSAMDKHESALNYFQKANEINKQIGSKYGMSGCLINIGDTYRILKKYSESEKALDTALSFAKEIGSKSIQKEAASNLSQLSEDMKQPDKALFYYKMFSNLKDSVFNEENTNQINELSAKYEAVENQKEIELLKKDKDLKDSKLKEQQIINISLFIGIALVVALLSLVFYRYLEKRKANASLEEKNIAIHVQKELVTEKNKEITDSINYARRIQDAMLPSQKILNEYFKENFIFYQPKDIISGDFYWASRKNDQLYIAAADCTGHGVPGALMSMIGISFLRQIINEMNIIDTAEILNRLHSMVLNALNEDVNLRNSKDGMDIALLKIDIGNKKAEFTGAVRPLYISSKNGFEVIKGDRFSIGGIKTMEETFSKTEIDLSGGKSFYMFSDGFADQFGQETGKKFMVKKLQSLLADISTQPMEDQHKLLHKSFNDWKGSLEQTDDVLLIGIKV